jgi:hypothetical protein
MWMRRPQPSVVNSSWNWQLCCCYTVFLRERHRFSLNPIAQKITHWICYILVWIYILRGKKQGPIITLAITAHHTPTSTLCKGTSWGNIWFSASRYSESSFNPWDKTKLYHKATSLMSISPIYHHLKVHKFSFASQSVSKSLSTTVRWGKCKMAQMHAFAVHVRPEILYVTCAI